MMKRLLLILISVFFCSLFLIGGFELRPQGFFDSLYGFSIKYSNKMISSKNRARLGMEIIGDKSFFYVSLDAVSNRVLNINSVKLHEAYWEFVGENWDIRLGKQIISWGKADGLRVTDLICPSDMTNFIAQEFDDVRIPVETVKFRLLFDKFNVEFIGIPVFSAGITPKQGNPWYRELSLDKLKNFKFNSPVEPGKKLSSAEVALKVSLFLQGIDLAFSTMYLWDDFPLFYIDKNQDKVVGAKYYRIPTFGFEAAMPRGEFVIRLEAALSPNKNFQTKNLDIIKKNSANCLLGLDWYPGNNWMITGQLFSSVIFNHSKHLINKKQSFTATLNVSKKILRERLNISNMIYAGLNGEGLMNRFFIDFSLLDELHLFLGIDIFAGNKKGMFGRYSENTQCWFKAKYSF